MSDIHHNQKTLRVGICVLALDGEAGRVARIVIDPQNHQPTYLVVEIGRGLRRREIAVPVSLVTSASAERVSLGVTRDALEDFPDYEVTVRDERYEKPFPVGRLPKQAYTPPANSGYLVLRQRSVPDPSVAIAKGMPVRDRLGRPIGSVEGLILDHEAREGKYIVFRRDPFSSLRLIPTPLVEDVTSSGVDLRIGSELANRLPEYSDELAQRWAGD